MAEPESLSTMQQNSYVKQADGDYAVKTVASGTGSAQPVSISQVDPNNRVSIIPVPVSNVTSQTDTASQNAPAANTVICTTALAVGTWEVEAITFIGGTTVASLEATNMRLRIGGVAIGRILNPVPGTSGGVGTGQLRCRVVVAVGTPALDIIAVSNATAGSVYSGSVVARRVL